VVVLADAPAPKAASVKAVPAMAMVPTDPASQLRRRSLPCAMVLLLYR
jgi:hypothetical protein